MARAYDASGLRSVLALGLFDEPERAFNVIPPGPHNEVMALLGDYVRPRPLEQIRETLEWSIRTHHLQDGRTSIMLAPRHTFGCSDALHHLIGDLSDQFDVGMHTHLLEFQGDMERAQELFGKPVLQHLEDLGVLNERWSFAHAIWVTDQDIELMARRRVSVVHASFTNTRSGSGI